MGGRNSIAFAGRNPDMLEKLVIVDIGPDIDPVGSARITRELVEVPEEFDSFEAAFQHVNSQNRFASESVMRRRLTHQTKELPSGKIGWRYDPEIREQRRNGTGAPPPDLWGPLSNITCPTLIVRGSETDTLSLDAANRMVETLADGKLVHVDNAAHMVFEDNPEGFKLRIGRFPGIRNRYGHRTETGIRSRPDQAVPGDEHIPPLRRYRGGTEVPHQPRRVHWHNSQGREFDSCRRLRVRRQGRIYRTWP